MANINTKKKIQLLELNTNCCLNSEIQLLLDRSDYEGKSAPCILGCVYLCLKYASVWVLPIHVYYGWNISQNPVGINDW